MAAAGLRSPLAEGPVVGDRLRRAVALSEGWFDTDAHAASFLIRDLSALDWDDQQGPPVQDYEPFDREIRPALDGILDSLANGRAVSLADLDGLAVAIRDAHLPPPIVVTPTP